MAGRVIECVPNFSEGRDARVVERIASAIESVDGVWLLGKERDADHNRSVITFAGAPEAVLEGALAGVAQAVESIDLTTQRGVHPRIGAADVVPFIPVEGIAMEECVRLAWRAGEEIWRRIRVPVYFYEAAARRAERARLENIRRGQFEGLREAVRTDPDRRPDAGDAELHPTAGATAVGARKFLIAYNINLATADVEIARRIARTIRASSGGLACVKAMGVMLASRNLAQVSMNLTDFETTPIHVVFEAVKREAAGYGVSVLASELIGLIPRKALEMAAGVDLQWENLRPDSVLEQRIADVAAARGDRMK
jgi:glutamate formiminotransferase